MIAQVLKQLETALKDDSVGYAVHVAAVASANSVTLPDVPDNHIYGTDTPVDAKKVNLPALVLTPTETSTEEIRSQGRRDSVHTVTFEYATEDPDEEEWRDEAMYMAEALMRFLDNFNSCNSSYVGTSGAILVQGWRADYTVTWKAPPNAIRGFIVEAEIYSRDTF